MMIKAKAHKKFQARAGAALIVVLGIVMVITIVAFAYLSRSDNEPVVCTFDVLSI